jgi:bifunctional enzyme CysN/CysC
MRWYAGEPLLAHLEGAPEAAGAADGPARLPVQYVIRHGGERHYAGRLASGTLRAGDEVVVLPSGLRSRVAAVETADGLLDAAVAPMSVTIRLDGELDVSRGDVLADPERPPVVARDLLARVCWMSEKPLDPRAKLLVKQTTRHVRALVGELVSRVNIETLEDAPRPERLDLNDLAVVKLRLAEPLAVDPYAANRSTGAFILVDEATNDTVGAGMVLEAS